MKYQDLPAELQNLTNSKIKITEIANAIGISKQNMHKRITQAKGDIPPEEIKMLEQAFNVLLVEETVPVDYYPEVFASCGQGSYVLSEQKELIQLPTKFFNHYSKVKKYSVINATGESMQPYIYPKDKLIVEHWEGEQIKDNQVYVFLYNNEVYTKRLIKNVDEIIIKSDNPDPIYRPRFIEKGDMKNIVIIGEIIGLMRNVRL